PGLGRGELQRRIQGERLAELLATGGDAVVRALDEREVLVGVDLVLRRQAAIERDLQALRRGVVVSIVELLQADAERSGFGLERTEHRAPDRMPGLGRRQLERRIGRERLAEILAARTGAAVGAMDEGEMLVGVGALAVAYPEVERALQAFRRCDVLAFVVLAHALAQRRASLARREHSLQLRARREGCDQDRGGGGARHLKRWRIRTASPGFTCTFCTKAGKVELRISMVWAPGGTSNALVPELMPRLLPSMRTSPHGVTTSSSFPCAPAAGFAVLAFSGFLSTLATTCFRGAGAGFSAAGFSAAGAGFSTGFSCTTAGFGAGAGFSTTTGAAA